MLKLAFFLTTPLIDQKFLVERNLQPRMIYKRLEISNKKVNFEKELWIAVLPIGMSKLLFIEKEKNLFPNKTTDIKLVVLSIG